MRVRITHYIEGQPTRVETRDVIDWHQAHLLATMGDCYGATLASSHLLPMQADGRRRATPDACTLGLRLTVARYGEPDPNDRTSDGYARRRRLPEARVRVDLLEHGDDGPTAEIVQLQHLLESGECNEATADWIRGQLLSAIG